jgi:hypothetical protein
MENLKEEIKKVHYLQELLEGAKVKKIWCRAQGMIIMNNIQDKLVLEYYKKDKLDMIDLTFYSWASSDLTTIITFDFKIKKGESIRVKKEENDIIVENTKKRISLKITLK